MNGRHVLIGALVFTWSLFLVSAATARLSQPSSSQTDDTIYLPFIAKSGLTIHYFRADVDIADPGDTIQLEWHSTGAVIGALSRLSPGGPIAEFWEVEPSGVFTYTINPAERNFISFILYVQDGVGVGIAEGLTIPLTCPDTWFFSPAPPGCPGAPALFSAGAEQPFEAGYMIWVEAQALIYVLFADGASPHWHIYADTWNGEPLCDAAPPGHSQPERGFGKVWCDEPGVRDRLGWATAPETGYGTAVQRDSAPKYTTLFLRAADGNVWKLWPERSGWGKIEVNGQWAVGSRQWAVGGGQ
jgi:hypothetical protein